MKIPYVMVRWVDSQAGPGWMTRKSAQEWADAPGQTHLSVGFRLPVGPEDTVTLSQSLQMSPNGSVGELLQIPKVAVKSIEVLGRVEH